MNLASDLQIYVKTTGTCNLDCDHCFTSGSKGTNENFDEVNTFKFLQNIVQEKKLNSLRLMYHGGEPLITPLSQLFNFYELTKSLDCQVSYGIQTNLVYNLTKEKILFFNTAFKTGIGTSWDPNIRFGSNNNKLKHQQEKLWAKNVKIMIEEGHSISLMVCLSQFLIKNYKPQDIIEYAISLGISFIQFERITSDGNSVLNPELHPKNFDVDQWLYNMYLISIEKEYYKKIGNMFINEIATSFIAHSQIGTKCRNCEQSIITINANGTLAGCPNSATQRTWGHINDDLDSFFLAPKRVAAICNEKNQKLECYSCEVRYACNGDCYKLQWQDHICPAPKSLMQSIHQTKNFNQLEAFLL